MSLLNQGMGIKFARPCENGADFISYTCELGNPRETISITRTPSADSVESAEYELGGGVEPMSHYLTIGHIFQKLTFILISTHAQRIPMGPLRNVLMEKTIRNTCL